MFGGPISPAGARASTRRHAWRAGSTRSVSTALYDYDPVWAKCVELGVSPTFHTASMGWPTHSSVSSYVYNHIGMFATAGETLARSLFLGGVPHRFPHAAVRVPGRRRRVGGVALRRPRRALGEAQPRRGRALQPRRTRPRAARRAVRAVRQRRATAIGSTGSTTGCARSASPTRIPPTLDEFAASGVDRAEDIRDVFTTQFHFGCEADDPMTALAFDTRRNPLGARLRALFASDVGHWDVPDVREVLPEAWELVERRPRHRGRLPRAHLREPGVAVGAGNPAFFEGTSVESAVAELLR